MLLGDILRKNAYYYPKQEALVQGDIRLTWNEVESRVYAIGNSLLELGLQKGDRVAMLSGNCYQYWEFFFSMAKTGLVGVPLNIRLNINELISYLSYTKPKALIVNESYVQEAKIIKEKVPSVDHVIGFGSGHGFELDYDTFINVGSKKDPNISLTEEDTYTFVMTSGTTGIPKAAMLSHRNAIQGSMSWLAEGISVKSTDSYLQNIPMFFNAGGPASIFQFIKGAKGVATPGFTPEIFMQTVEKERISHTILVPTMLTMLLNHPDFNQYDLSSLKCLIMGGAPLGQALLRQGIEAFGSNIFFPIYGSTETYAAGLILSKEHMDPNGSPEEVQRLKSVGKPHPNIEVRVVSENGENVEWGTDQTGEIILRGENVCKGYWDKPEETRDTFRDGWLHTGDVGKIDGDGFIYVVDRIKDMIITGGINVYSVEIEGVIAVILQ